MVVLPEEEQHSSQEEGEPCSITLWLKASKWLLGQEEGVCLSHITLGHLDKLQVKDPFRSTTQTWPTRLQKWKTWFKSMIIFSCPPLKTSNNVFLFKRSVRSCTLHSSKGTMLHSTRLLGSLKWNSKGFIRNKLIVKRKMETKKKNLNLPLLMRRESISDS